MIGKEIIESRDVTLTEAKDYLEKRKKISELSYEQKQAYETAKENSKNSMKKVREATEALMKVNKKIDNRLAVLLIDNLPRDKEDLRVVLEKRGYRPDDSDVKKIVKVLSELK